MKTLFLLTSSILGLLSLLVVVSAWSCKSTTPLYQHQQRSVQYTKQFQLRQQGSQVEPLSPYGLVRQCQNCRQLFSSSSGQEKHETVNGGGDNQDDSIIPPTGVTLKLAFDGNYGVGDLSEIKSERFTCEKSLDMVHRLRYDSDAVLVGRMTVTNDDCTLTIRRDVPLKEVTTFNGSGHPVRVILDPKLSLDRTKYKIFNDGLQTIVYHCVQQPQQEDNNPDENDNVKLVYLPSSSSREVVLSPRDVCDDLAKNFQIHHVMVEGGPQTAKTFLGASVVDRAILVFAPFCFKVPMVSNMTRETFTSAGLELIYEGTLGDDRVEHWSKPGLPWPNKKNIFKETKPRTGGKEGDDSSYDDDASTRWP